MAQHNLKIVIWCYFINGRKNSHWKPLLLCIQIMGSDRVSFWCFYVWRVSYFKVCKLHVIIILHIDDEGMGCRPPEGPGYEIH